MIGNERQYRISKKELARFRAALADLREDELIAEGIDPVIAAAQRASIEAQMGDLADDVAAYEQLVAGNVGEFVFELEDVGDVFVKARISRGLSQKELANLLSLKEQQIQRYEAERYKTASLGRLTKIASALDITLTGTALCKHEESA